MFLFGFNQEEAIDAHLFTYFFGRPVGLWYPTQNYSWPGPPNLYPSEHRPPSRVGKLVFVFCFFFLRLSRHNSMMTRSLYTVSKDDTHLACWWPAGEVFFVICILKVTLTTASSTATNVLESYSKRVTVGRR